MRLDPTHFDNWFKAMNGGCEPFPWQQRLFHEWLCPKRPEDTRWPSLIKLPTASGKTALIDLAILALAAGSPCSRRRIVFVVDRRVVVDEAALRAHAIKQLLDASLNSPADPLYEIGRSLVSLGAQDPLVVATLRGGIPGDDGWARSPAQPAVVLSTVDQAGSRLLFRAYGHAPRSWPIHAGLLGRDTVMIIDEAHCAAPFCETVKAVTDRWQHFVECPIGPTLSLVRMSATPNEEADFELGDEDRKHPVLSRRLGAQKPAELVLVGARQEKDRSSLTQAIIERSDALLESMTHGVVGIVVNRVADARFVFEQLSVPEDRKILLTGRARGWERDLLLKAWLPRLRAGARLKADAPLAVIATQCIEVGANLDFDYLVTEIAPLDALRQRFGRVDRLGERTKRVAELGEHAETPGVIIATTAQVEAEDRGGKFPDRVYGHALSRTWDWLQGTANGNSPFVDFGIEALESILPEGEELERLCQDVGKAYSLLPAHLDILAQTNPAPQPEPEVSAFLHGTTQGSADVTVVWRCDLPDNDTNVWVSRVSVQPPVTGEGCPVPVWEFRQWLAGVREQVVEDSGDIEGRASDDDAAMSEKPVLQWRGLNDAKVLSATKVMPGNTVVVPSAYGGCDKFGWNPLSVNEVPDIGDAVSFMAGRRPVLRLEALSRVLSSAIDAQSATVVLEHLRAAAAGDEDAPDVSDVLSRLATDEHLPSWLRELSQTLSVDRRRRWIETEGAYTIVGSRSRGEDLSTAEDGSSLGVPVTLTNHCIRVRGYAKRFAKSVGLQESLISDIALAAVLHDVGKCDPRFQIWLHDGDEIAAALADAPLAKSGENPRNRAAVRRARERARYPRDARHEVQSLALIQDQKLIQQKANDWDLVQHLVISHHGFGRPFVPVVADSEPVFVSLNYGTFKLACTSNHRLWCLDSGIVERYWRLTRRYGWWGLAWLEAIMRLADHRRSEDEARREVNCD